ncbi:hypothetical protein TNIN_399681 [Trichonephila inaurata madagascariensis]|uniref:Uncharacterized protein n=1 Tax=Trichonephila inaurata madagascariensis TaxID=2747483 RepID=A0A8X6YM38_9ARAC|nr:hypothetical protein TNIN_399681 [Trichonephila inaurata madagascariensis]
MEIAVVGTDFKAGKRSLSNGGKVKAVSPKPAEGCIQQCPACGAPCIFIQEKRPNAPQVPIAPNVTGS